MAALLEMRFIGGFAMLIREREFWPVFLGMFLAQASWWLVFHQVATSQLTFASDNRSTALRVCVVIQQLVYFGGSRISVGVSASTALMFLTMTT